jgi:hypothetical protein
MFILLHPMTMAAAEKYYAKAAMNPPVEFLQSDLNFGTSTYFACSETKSTLEWFCTRTGLNGVVFEGQPYDQAEADIEETPEEASEEASEEAPEEASEEAPPMATRPVANPMSQRVPPTKASPQATRPVATRQAPPQATRQAPTPGKKAMPKGFNKR